MSRISIDVTTAQHQKLKALAALQGLSIKDFVLARTLGSAEPREAAALAELEALLDARRASARTNGWSARTVKEIGEQLRHERPDRAPGE